ncbi:hypothetical protein GGS24DRAFT_514470 [Hypoxylon argillaceum]|nr:hypothetical protein GGS24DRAFT_514470 [Hypoxylon argillaceum]
MASAPDSGANEALSVQSVDDNVHIRKAPAFVVWRDSNGETRSLSDFSVSLLHTSTPRKNKALVQFQATMRLKKGSEKPPIHLFIKPDQICRLDYIEGRSDLDSGDEGLHQQAREKLGTSTHLLRFELRSPATFVVPNETPFEFFRAGSQAVWKSLMDFARDSHCFFLHFPTNTWSKERLLSFCEAASSRGTLRPICDNVLSLYGGKGGKIVDPHTNDGNESTQIRARVGVLNDTTPPAYEDRTTTGPSLSPIGPPLCLSPGPDARRLGKRRRSSSDCGEMASYDKGRKASDRILDAISGLQRTIDEVKVKVEEIEGRVKQLEEDQQNLADEVRAHMEPLWDEMDARLQSQEDREHGYIKDVVEEFLNENIQEKVTEAIDEYFDNDDEGQELIHKIISERVPEATRNYLQGQHFAGHFTFSEETYSI